MDCLSIYTRLPVVPPDTLGNGFPSVFSGSDGMLADVNGHKSIYPAAPKRGLEGLPEKLKGGPKSVRSFAFRHTLENEEPMEQ